VLKNAINSSFFVTCVFEFDIKFSKYIYNMAWTTNSNSSGSKNWAFVASSSNGVYLAACTANNDGIYVSTNKGLTWNGPQYTMNVCVGISVSSTGQYMAACSGSGPIPLSTDYGTTWTNRAPAPYGWGSFVMSSTGTPPTLFATYYDNGIGGVYNSFNYGASWTRNVTGLPAYSLTAISCSSDGTTVYTNAFDGSGGIVKSTDSGSTFGSKYGFYPNNLTSISSNISANIVYAAGQSSNAFIYRSINGGSTWSTTSAPNINWKNLACNSSGTTVIAGSQNGVIYLSTDTGVTWIQQSTLTGAGNMFVASDSSGINLVAAIANGYIWTETIPCFKEDTKILTNKGYIPIQDLRKGDLVQTLYNGFTPIYRIGKRDIYHHASEQRIKDQLYQCSQTEYPELFEDLVLTGCHSILVDEFKEGQREKMFDLVKDIYVTDHKYRLAACVDERTTVYKIPGKYTIYHVALENDFLYGNYGIYANGLLVESCDKYYINNFSNMDMIE